MYIVLGKNGYIAEAIVKELKSRGLPYTAWSRSDVDYTDLTELKYHLYILGENLHVINCAGFTGKPNVDACELAKADCIEGNVLLPAMVSQLCQENQYGFTQISSGCIYGGYQKDFTEEDAPNFDFQNGSFYSGTKALAEKIVLKKNRDSYIFRLRIPFDEFESPRNYITKMLNYDKLLNAENSISHKGDFVKACIYLLKNQAEFGIYNIVNSGSVTTGEVAEILKDAGLMESYTLLDEGDFYKEVNPKAPRSNCVLDNTKLINSGFEMRSAVDALKDSIKTWKTESIEE